MRQKALIVGAGYAGVAAAIYLNKKGKKDNLDVTLIDKNDYHTLLTELHEVAGNRQDEDTIKVPLKEIFRDTKVKLVQDQIDHFDFEGKRLVGKLGQYDYDYCIVAIGSKPAFYCIKGLEEHALTLWSYDDAVRIREHVRSCFTKARLEQDPAERSRLLTFVVGGAGYTGVEMIGELAHWVKTLARENAIDRADVRLILVDLLDRVLPSLGEKNSAKSYKYMREKLGIEIMLETGINELTEERVVTSEGDIESRTLIWCAGVCCSNESDTLGLERSKQGSRLLVDDTAQTKHKGVYAVGDCSALADDEGVPYAAMVENAIQSANGAAANILRQIRGQEPERVEVKFHGTMVCIGNYFAVSEIMGKSLPSWLSVLMKFLVNAHYLFDIMGFRGPFNYLKNEIVNRRQDKHFLEKHYSKKMQAWWLVPLRMFMGFYWLFEGLQKLTQGWFSSPKLAEFSGLSRGYQLAADAVSAATGGGLRIDEVFDIKLKIVNLEIAYASKMVEGVAVTKDLFAKIDLLNFGNFNLVPWVMENWALSSRGWEMFFQSVVTLAEIVLGLLFLSGSLTFLASVATLLLLATFVTSTGLYYHTWWLAFASIATMGGAGRAFGFDHYLLPWLNRVWESIWKNGRLKLFFPRKKRSTSSVSAQKKSK